MKIKKAHVVAFLMVSSAIGGAAAVWQFYLADALSELSEHEARQLALEDKLVELQTTFEGKTPGYIIDQWTLANNPWNDAKNSRKAYFRLALDAPVPVEYPENERIARFFYEREYPDRETALLKKLADTNCNLMLSPPYFGSRDMISLPPNPNEEEVVQWLSNFDRGAHTVGFLADAGVVSIIEIIEWPESTNGTGSLTTHTTGLDFTISMRDLVNFLEQLRAAPQFYKVEAIWISNPALRNTNANVSVQMILTQAVYTVREPAAEPVTIGGASGGGLGGGLGGGFGGPGNNRTANPDGPSWWKTFRRTWLPF